jgi:hypothetical protein
MEELRTNPLELRQCEAQQVQQAGCSFATRYGGPSEATVGALAPSDTRLSPFVSSWPWVPWVERPRAEGEAPAAH